MITGANTNVRYRGILFHVQTEDSGRANPHVISHLYHGGTILGSQKTDYSEHLETQDLIGVVRALIERQHAAMLAKLNGGGFDAAIAARLGDTAVDGGLEAESRPDTEPEPDSKESTAPEREAATAAPREPAAPPLAAVRRGERGFGEGIGSSKPLDEVILEYLAEKARGRAPERSGGAARKTRTGG